MPTAAEDAGPADSVSHWREGDVGRESVPRPPPPSQWAGRVRPGIVGRGSHKLLNVYPLSDP